ncbi:MULTISPECIES: helix-turn-helix transcriptional regulator [unclassified Microcoleus]|uniref:helix-turn-helix transcriptional regulator n=1 Tax=unclassified Microcoleus TaxID=2642155 RepID=UPI002FD78CFE
MDTPSHINFRFLFDDYPDVETESSLQVPSLPPGSQTNSQSHENNPSQNDSKNSGNRRQRQPQRYVMDDQTKKKFAELIYEMRANRPYRAFGRLLGVTHPTIKAWENLEGVPDLENLKRVAKFRGETLEQFKLVLAGKQKPSQLEQLVQQVRTISKEELAVVLQVIAERIAS